MTKRTLSNKGRYSVLKVSGFRARMSTPQGRNTIRNRRQKGRKTISNRRKKGRKNLAIRQSI